jgi:hypothetical protein
MKTKTEEQINAERAEADLPPLNFDLFRKVIRKLETAPRGLRAIDSLYANGHALAVWDSSMSRGLGRYRISTR